MKRLILLAVGFALALNMSSAPAHSGAGGGFKGGLNIANIHGDDTDDWGSKMGFCAGGFVNYSVAGVVAIQPEILYTTKGAIFTIGNVEWTRSLSYIEIPILLKLIAPLPGLMKPTLFVGLAPGIKLSATQKVTIGTISTENDWDDVKATDLGLVVGGGLDFWGPFGNIMLDARYTTGLATIDESNNDWDFKNGVFSLSLGYCFQP